MSSLGEALPKEIKRVQELREEYLSLPNNAGFIVASMMKAALDNALQALSSGDVIKIMQAYEDLKGFEG